MFVRVLQVLHHASSSARSGVFPDHLPRPGHTGVTAARHPGCVSMGRCVTDVLQMCYRCVTDVLQMCFRSVICDIGNCQSAAAGHPICAVSEWPSLHFDSCTLCDMAHTVGVCRVRDGILRRLTSQ